MTEPTSHYSKARVWWLAARPKTLLASATPILMAGAMAIDGNVFHLPSFLAALCGGVLIQVGTNYANDLFDFKKAVDTSDRLGPLRVTQAGLVTPKEMRNATLLVLGLAFLVGVYLVSRAGLPIVIIGLLSLLFAVLYTAGPFPLGYKGLGELFVLVFFGPVPLAGTYYAMSLQINLPVLLAGVAPGLLSIAILVVNNVRDIDTDRASGKRTLAVRLGRGFARAEYAVCVGLALCYPVIHYVIFRSHAYVLIALLATTAAIPLIKTVFTSRDGAVLNETLAATGRLLLLYGLCFSFGWLL